MTTTIDTRRPRPPAPAPTTDQLPDDVRFTRGPARRPLPTVVDPRLQWSTGLPTHKREIYAGWLIEAGRVDELDQACDRANIEQRIIVHGSGNRVTHWTLPHASLFVVCDGVQGMGEMRESGDRYGVAFAWRTLPDGRRQSVLRARVFVQELAAVDYLAPLVVSLKSTITGDMLDCLHRHYATIDTINPIRAAAGKSPIAVPFYAVSMALGAGPEVSRGQAGQTKPIAPMVEVGTRDAAYIRAHWCKRAWAEAIEAVVDDTIRWSTTESARIAEGDDVAPDWD